MSGKKRILIEGSELFSAAGLPEHAAPKAVAQKLAFSETKPTGRIDWDAADPSSGEAGFNERYLRDTEVAQRYNVCRQTVWRWAALKKLPEPAKLSEGVTRWRLSDLLAHEGSLRRHARLEVRGPRRVNVSKLRERK